MKIKIHWPTVIVAAIWIAGCLKSFILPWLKYHFFSNSWAWLKVPEWMARPGDTAVLLFGFLTALGFIIFLVRGGRLQERKESGPLTFLGLVILVGGLFALAYDAFQGGLTETLYNASETPFWAVSLGLAMAFYKLEEEKSLLAFFVPMGIFYLLPINISLIKHFAPDLVSDALLKRTTYYTFPAAFKNPWFWSDSFVDYLILPYFLIWSLTKREEPPRSPYLVKRFMVEARKSLISLFILLGIAGAVAVGWMFAEPTFREVFMSDSGKKDNKKPPKPENGETTNGGTKNGGTSNGGDSGTNVAPRGGCPAGMCWSNGYCCPKAAQWYCQGGCYLTRNMAMSVSHGQCATWRIVCD